MDGCDTRELRTLIPLMCDMVINHLALRRKERPEKMCWGEKWRKTFNVAIHQAKERASTQGGNNKKKRRRTDGDNMENGSKRASITASVSSRAFDFDRLREKMKILSDAHNSQTLALVTLNQQLGTVKTALTNADAQVTILSEALSSSTKACSALDKTVKQVNKASA